MGEGQPYPYTYDYEISGASRRAVANFCAKSLLPDNEGDYFIPNFRFDITPIDHSNMQKQYSWSAVNQSSVLAAKPGEANVPVLQLQVYINGDQGTLTVNNFKFSGKGSQGKITAARLYYTEAGRQDVNSFNPSAATTHLLQIINFPNGVGNTDTFNFSAATQNIPMHGLYNF
jgi:hypothetical protein